MAEVLKPDPKVRHFDHIEVLVTQGLPLPSELSHLDNDELRKLEKDTVKRLDCFLLPAVVLLFLLNILDRNNIANAKIVGLTDTLNLTNNQYNTCLMIFYVGYVMTQLPSNVLIAKVRPSIYIGCVTSCCVTIYSWFGRRTIPSWCLPLDELLVQTIRIASKDRFPLWRQYACQCFWWIDSGGHNITNGRRCWSCLLGMAFHHRGLHYGRDSSASHPFPT